MKINKKMGTSILVVLITLGIMVGTLFYANQYTSKHAATNNTFQKENGTMNQGNFQKRPDNNGSKGGPTNATNKKPEN